MKLEKLVGDRFRERPSDCNIDSHALMVRGGYMKYVTNGIFSSYMPLKRITRKIEQIIREEMDAIDGQEVQFPVVMPASIWQESGRYESIGKEMARFHDRSGSPLVLGMTHEEVEKSTWGKPEDINKTTYAWGTTEQWCYSNYRYIYFDNGIVTAIQE